MGMQQTPRRQKSPWARYAPFIVVVVVAAIVGVTLATRSSSNKSSPTVQVGAPKTSVSGTNGVPLFYNDAKAQGVAATKKWHNCDTATGRVAIPILSPPPCVESFTGDNGGATSPGVTATTIKIGYYIPKPDPTLDGVLAQAGAYDPPDKVVQAYKDYAAIYGGTYELYGRKVQLVRIDGSGASTDSVQAHADRIARQPTASSRWSAARRRRRRSPTSSRKRRSSASERASSRSRSATTRRTSRTSGPPAPPPTRRRR